MTRTATRRRPSDEQLRFDGRTVIGEMADYEYQRLTLPRGTSRNVAQRLLTDAAEHGHWELDRLRLYPDGTRKVTLRRRIIRMRSTLSV